MLVIRAPFRPTCRVMLSERHAAMLDFERSWWENDDPRDQVIRARFQCSPDEYHAELTTVARRPGLDGPRPARGASSQAAAPAGTQTAPWCHRGGIRRRRRTSRMSNEESGLAASRRTPRQGAGGSPVGSWLTIALAVVAVIAGFLHLEEHHRTTPAPRHPSIPGPSPTRRRPAPTTRSSTSPCPWRRKRRPRRPSCGSPRARRSWSPTANTVGGSAGNMTKTLDLAGYTTVDPVNATGPNLEASIVYFDSAQALAEGRCTLRRSGPRRCRGAAGVDACADRQR